MTIAQQIGDLHLAKDYDDRRRDFIKLVKYRALGRTGPAEAAHLAIADRAPQRVVDAIKATSIRCRCSPSAGNCRRSRCSRTAS